MYGGDNMALTRTSKNKELLDQLKGQADTDQKTEATAFEKTLQDRQDKFYTPEYNGHVTYSNVYDIENIDAEIKTNGVSPELANELFLKEIKKSEDAVKELLKSAGLTTVPIEVFDALVSFQHQVGDASYIYYEGRKLSMLPWLKKRRWDRVADYLAADERDRQRRAKEAAIIYYLDYGTNSSEKQVIDKGFRRAIAKAKKDPNYPPEKKAALTRAYYNHYGYLPQGLTGTEKNQLDDTSSTDQLVKKAGPWPY